MDQSTLQGWQQEEKLLYSDWRKFVLCAVYCGMIVG